MKMSRVMVCVALVLVVAATAAAQNQGQGRRGGGFGAFGGRGGQSLVSLAAQESVQKDLGLAADAVTKVEALNTEYRAAQTKEREANPFPQGGFQNLSAAERTAYLEKSAASTAKLNTEFTPKLQAIVGEAGIKRLKQIQVQAQGATALNNADVVSELKITDDQKKKIGDLITEYQTKTQGLFGQGADFQEAARKMREINTERDGKLEGVLTGEQKEKYTALKGKTFDVSTLRQGTGGGRRGKGNNN